MDEIAGGEFLACSLFEQANNLLDLIVMAPNDHVHVLAHDAARPDEEAAFADDAAKPSADREYLSVSR